MSKVRVLVVEDEIIIADNICDTLEEMGYEVLEPATNYTEAIELLETEPIDVAILDIQLTGKKSGVDIANKINEIYKIPFLFLTSNTDGVTLNEAIKAEPYAYLAKPFNEKELYTSIELALYNFSKKQERLIDQEKMVIRNALFFKEDRIFKRINFSDILYIKSEHVYVEIITKTDKHIVRGSLNNFLPKLDNTFYRCHRSYIINLDYLEGVNHNDLFLGNTAIPLGKNQREELVAKLNKI